MKRWQRELIRIAIVLLVIAGALWIASCADTAQYLQTPQGSAVLATSETVANVALSAVATTYAGPVAGQLTSAGLNALGTVLQGYVNSQVPPQVVKTSPGVAGVGSAVAPLVSSNKPIDQTDVNKVFKAAKLAAKK